MKVLLVFPPFWIPYRPYLSMPSLYAYLKDSGIDVVQKDFNIEAYELLMSENYLTRLRDKLQNKLEILESKPFLSAGIEQGYYNDLFRAVMSIPYIAGEIDNAKRVFRDGVDFYDIGKLSRAREILKQAQEIISTASFPSGQDLVWPLNMRIQRSFEEIKKITQNSEENPFINLYESYLLPYIEEQNPDVIGISIAGDSQFIPALTMSRLIKSRHKDIHVVVGGYVVTLFSDVLMKYEELFTGFIDSAIVNEGERPLLELVEHISSGKDLKDVPNLIYYDNGQVCANEVLPAADINSLPTPDFDGFPLGLYLSPEPVLPVLSSRGCYWGKCAFCSHNASYRWHYRVRDAAKVVSDMQELSRRYGVKHFAFSDEAISPASMSRICDEIIDRGAVFRCSTNVRLESQFTPELCRKMYRAGFRLLYLGLESGCNRVLGLMGKGTNRETSLAVCKNIHEAGIWSHLYTFMGFPGESWEEALETVEFLRTNKEIIGSFNIASFLLNKGADVVRSPEKYGITSIDAGPNPDFSLAYDYSVSSGLTCDEALEMSSIYRDKLIDEYEGKEVFKLDYEEILLYLSHFEKSDPWLKNLSSNIGDRESLEKEVSSDSVPVMRSNIIVDSPKFSIVNIMGNLSAGKKEIAYPETKPVVFDVITGKVISIAPPVSEILLLCDGRRDIRQIASQLSKKYNAPVVNVEKDCLSFFKQSSPFLLDVGRGNKEKFLYK
jgi:hypothetical protein